MPGMTSAAVAPRVAWRVAAVAPHTSKIIKNSLSVFEREKIFYKMVYLKGIKFRGYLIYFIFGKFVNNIMFS